MSDNKNEQVVCVLDIGSSKICAMVATIDSGASGDGEVNSVLGWAYASSQDAIKNGEIISMDGASRVIAKVLEEVAIKSNCNLLSIIVGVGGYRSKSCNIPVKGAIRNEYVTSDDVRDLIALARLQVQEPAYIILHTINQDYIIDSNNKVTEPLGMCGNKLDGNFHIIKLLSNSLVNIDTCVTSCNVIPAQYILQTIASGEAVLTKDEKDLGVCCIDIGSGTTDMVVYKDGKIVYTGTIPVGGDNITKDMATTLKTSFFNAEKIKIKYGSTFSVERDFQQVVKYPSIGQSAYRMCTLDAFVFIIETRMKEIFEICNNELINCNFDKEVLGAGIVLTGGCSLLKGIVDLAASCFNHNVRLGWPYGEYLSPELRHPSYSTLYGLVKASMKYEDYMPEREVDKKEEDAREEPRIAEAPKKGSRFMRMFNKFKG